MELPPLLKTAIAQQTTGIKISELVQESQKITQQYKHESGKGKALIVDKQAVLTYTLVRMPATFGAVFKALEWSIPFLKQMPQSLLDAGAGTGTASWAASQLIDLKTITCLERETEMIKMGKALMAEHPMLSQTKWQQGDLSLITTPLKADLVIASYALNELQEDKRQQVLQRLYQAAQQLFILIEPGTPEGFRQIQSARDFLINQGAFIVAPCPHHKTCPLSQNDWCHFASRIARSKAHRFIKEADRAFEDEKFCYLAVSPSPLLPVQKRILRSPFITKGSLSLSLCTQEGIQKQTISKREKDLFKQAKKLQWGDPF